LQVVERQGNIHMYLGDKMPKKIPVTFTDGTTEVYDAPTAKEQRKHYEGIVNAIPSDILKFFGASDDFMSSMPGFTSEEDEEENE